MVFSEAKISKLLRGIHKGDINVRSLPNDLYTATAKHLMSGAYKGFGFDLSTAKGQRLEKLLDIRENTYMFSGAKTYMQTNEMVGLLKDENGKIKTFKKFKDDVMPVYKEYNVNWLEAEYQTAIGQSQIIDHWINIVENKDILPILKYVAVEDENTSALCRSIDGTTLPVDHPFWRRFMPLNHYRCRCTVSQHAKGDERTTRAKKVDEISKNAGDMITSVFDHNAGINAEIFNKSHPYFDVPKKDRALARKNFNLPIPKSD